MKGYWVDVALWLLLLIALVALIAHYYEIRDFYRGREVHIEAEPVK